MTRLGPAHSAWIPAAILLIALSAWGAGAAAGAAAPAGDNAPMLLRIAGKRPPCSAPAALPVIPNDPAAVTVPGAGGSRRCLGTRPAELELRVPVGQYAWLSEGPVNPPVWLDLGTVIVNPQDYEVPPLGLKLSGEATDLTLEVRRGDLATLTPLTPDAWTEVATPDGGRLWVRASR